MPKRSYEKIHVPGRNGDLIIDNGSWENVTRSYEVSIASDQRHYREMANSLSEWLHSSTTYARLEDSYEPEYYRMAACLTEIEFSNVFNRGGKTTIEFDCKPQRFLKTGDMLITMSVSDGALSNNRLLNPTRFKALPIIKVYGTGSGTLYVITSEMTYEVQISAIENGMVIDSEIQDAYLGSNNKNPVISVPNGFPALVSGMNTFSISGGIIRVEVTPKWYTL